MPPRKSLPILGKYRLVDIHSALLHFGLIEVFFDGLCQPMNPGGIACYAFVAQRDGVLLHREYGLAAEPYSKDSTNNVAEYTVLIKALEWLVSNSKKDEPIRIASDSKLVVSQMNGEFKIKSKRIMPLYKRAIELKNSLGDVEIRWVPREENREADSLTNRAYKEALRARMRIKTESDQAHSQ